MLTCVHSDILSIGNHFTWNYTGTGLCGGAYFRTSAILDAFSDAAVADLDWKTLVGLWNKNVYVTTRYPPPNPLLFFF